MKNKLSLFVGLLIALSVNLQCNIEAFAEDDSSSVTAEEQSLEAVQINAEQVNDEEIINGTEDLSAQAFAKDEMAQ